MMKKCPSCGKYSGRICNDFKPDVKRRQQITSRLRTSTSEADEKLNLEKDFLLFERGELLKELAEVEREIEIKEAKGTEIISMQCKHCHCQWQYIKTDDNYRFPF
jgi:hypothetical protein